MGSSSVSLTSLSISIPDILGGGEGRGGGAGEVGRKVGFGGTFVFSRVEDVFVYRKVKTRDVYNNVSFFRCVQQRKVYEKDVYETAENGYVYSKR